jgi:hypothetical protein
MIENQRQYETEKGRYNLLIELVKEYKGKLNNDKTSKTKIQYNVFRSQLSEIKKDIKKYEKANNLESAVKTN